MEIKIGDTVRVFKPLYIASAGTELPSYDYQLASADCTVVNIYGEYVSVRFEFLEIGERIINLDKDQNGDYLVTKYCVKPLEDNVVDNIDAIYTQSQVDEIVSKALADYKKKLYSNIKKVFE